MCIQNQVFAISFSLNWFSTKAVECHGLCKEEDQYEGALPQLWQQLSIKILQLSQTPNFQ